MFPLFGIVHRMIFWELARVFLLALTGLTGLFLIGGVVQSAAQLGLGPGQLITVIPLLIPSMLPFTIPATTLFAACVVYGRVSNDNEAVALKAGGVDLLTILRPALVLGVGATLVTGGLYYAVIPRTQQLLQEQLLKDPEEILYNRLRRERNLNLPNFPYVIYVRDVQGRRLVDVVVKRRAKQRDAAGNDYYHGYDFVARAREAELVVNQERRKLAIHPDRWVVSGGTAYVDAKDVDPIEVDLPDIFSANTKGRPAAQVWDELAARADELEREKAALLEKREQNRRNIEREPDPGKRRLAIDQEKHYNAWVLPEKDRQIRNVRYEQWYRPALAGGCLCFALIGCPVGLWANRADYLSTFVTCFLPTVFIYYPVMLAGGGLARDGKVPMPVGIFAADALGGVAAALLVWRLIRR